MIKKSRLSVATSLLLSGMAISLTGCGGNGISSDTTLTGKFVDAPVAGLRYSTDSGDGKTDYNGELTYGSGDNCTFYLGSLELGTVACQPVMSPYVLFGDEFLDRPSQKTKNLARILQSLDKNSSDSGVIVIDPIVADHFVAPEGFDLNASSNDLNITAVIAKAKEVYLANGGEDNITYNEVNESVAVSNMYNYFITSNDEAIQTHRPDDNSTSIGIQVDGYVESNESITVILEGPTTPTETNTTTPTETNTTTPTTPTNSAPTITSGASASVAENQTGAYTITATDADNDTLTYSISGTDATSFSVDSSTGVVTFVSAPATPLS